MQWIEVVWQLTRQFENAFEFSQSFLLELIDAENDRIEKAWKSVNTQNYEDELDNNLADTLEELEQSFDEAV